MDAFEVFETYLAVKNHFTAKNYDFFKYGGKVKTSKESFLNRRDKLHFYKLSRRYSPEEIVDFLVANFIKNDKVWVGDLLDEKADKTYREYLKRKEARTYFFEQDLDTLLLDRTPEDIFRIGREYPPLFEEYLWEKVGMDTLVIINRYVPYIKKWDADRRMSNDPLWEKTSIVLKKYSPFVDFDSKKIVDILKKKM